MVLVVGPDGGDWGQRQAGTPNAKAVAIGPSCPTETKGCRPHTTTTPLAPRLTILPVGLPPNGTGRRLGGRSRVRAKEPVREATAEIFPPGWN